MIRHLIVAVVVMVARVVWADSAVLLVEGKMDAPTRQAIRDAAAKRLSDAGWDLLPQPSRSDSLAKCMQRPTPACVPQLVHVGADRIVTLVVEERGPDSILIAYVAAGRDGQALLQDQRFCNQCTFGDFGELTRTFVGEVIQKLTAGPGTAILELRSVPAGARVTVDHEPVGLSDLEYRVEPGSHTISFDKPGHRIEVRSVTAAAGEHRRIDVVLAPSVDERREGHPFPWKWVALASGVACVGTGVTLIAVHEPDVSGGSRSAEALNTRVPGIMTAAAGVILLGTSTYLFLRDRPSPVAVAILPGGGATLSVGGHF